MVQLVKPFDATTVDPTQSAGNLPVGKHPVVITESEVKANAANDGGMLVLTLTIIDGPSKGQTGPYRLNLYNKSEKAVEIAHRQLSAICHVVGVYQIEHTEALHNIPFIVEVALQKDAEAAAKGYTEIKGVYYTNGNPPGKPGAGQPAAQQQAGNGGGWNTAPGGPGPSAQPAQTAQPAAGGGWGGNPAPAQQQAPAQAQSAANATGGWGGAPAGNAAPNGAKPSWAK